MFEIRIDIPALDRLCAILERNGADIVESVQNATQASKDKPVAPVVVEMKKETPKDEAPQKAEIKPVEAKKEKKEVPKTETKEAPKTETKAPAKKADPSVVLQDVMVLARYMCQDPEKREIITGKLFDEFKISKLSDLKPDQLDAFTDALNALEEKH